MKKVSVIVPVYNVGKYINQCIQSLIDQVYKNLEIILIDDGSTDESLDICQKFAKQDNRVKVYYQKNSGLSSARNYGLSLSHGDYIVFVDGDDFVNANYIQHLVDTISKYDADIAVTSYIRMNDNGAYFVPLNPSPSDMSFNGVHSTTDWLKNAYQKMGLIFVSAWGKIYQKRLFHHIRYHGIADDEFTTWRIYALSNTIAFDNAENYVYRKNDTSITSQQASELPVRQLNALQERIAVLTMAGLDVSYLLYNYRAFLSSVSSTALQTSNFSSYYDARFKQSMLGKYLNEK